MTGRRGFIAAVLVLVALPALFASMSAAAFHAHNRTNGSVVSSGEVREYFVHVPRSYDVRRPAPLVISLHGAGGWPVQQMDLTGWNALADREGFIVVYPWGANRGGPRVWRNERRGEGSDVRFISDLIDKMEKDYRIDRTRIFANGISNGGAMTFALSCTLSDRIAAFGTVAAAHVESWSGCIDQPAAPMIAFHGMADPLTPYHGSGGSWLARWPLPDIPKWTAKWARRNRCDSVPVDSAVAPDVMRREYVHCAGDASVVLYSIRDGGHTWPGGKPLPEWFAGPTNMNVDATAEMWTFFSRHPLRSAVRP